MRTIHLRVELSVDDGAFIPEFIDRLLPRVQDEIEEGVHDRLAGWDTDLYFSCDGVEVDYD